MSELGVRAFGGTSPGKVRDHNEDTFTIDPELGLYAVFDGMGGARAGDVASATARDIVHAFVRERVHGGDPQAILNGAMNAASAAVYELASSQHDRKGMGTTAVACLVRAAGARKHATIAHVGDSRAYLLRDGRLTQLTRDHSVVGELLATGAISAHDAANHFFKNVLSRNIGAKPETNPDFCEVELSAGDRILLCSDGLYGFASHEAVQYLIGSSDPPEKVVEGLIDAAMRGGGGDNITALVIDGAAAEVPRATQVLRSSGALAWWGRREVFREAARQLDVASSPICSVLSGEEALDIVAGNLCEAIFHDLEKSTGVNVWTYAENLAHGWLDQGGAYSVLANLLDLLGTAARAVIDDLAKEDPALAAIVDSGTIRALVVADMAIGGVLAERLRTIEGEIVQLHAEHRARKEREEPKSAVTDVPTQPWARATRVAIDDPASPEVLDCLNHALRRAAATFRLDQIMERQTLEAAHHAALSAAPAAAQAAVREMWGSTSFDTGALSPVLIAVDQARAAFAKAIAAHPDREVGLAAMRRVATAQVELATALAYLVIEGSMPQSDRLRELARETSALRGEVAANESRIGELKRRSISASGSSGGRR